MFSKANRKRYAWIAMGMGAGGTLLFVLVCVFLRLPRLDEIHLMIWPVVSILVMAISAFLLKRLYRQAPETYSGYWHLSLLDLIAISFFAALCMSGWRALWPNSLGSAGIAVSLLLSSEFTICLLLGARFGHEQFSLKVTCALSLFFQILGWMGCGAILLVVLNSMLETSIDYAMQTLCDILFFTNFNDGSDDVGYWIIHLLRAGWLCVPIGFILGLMFRFLVSRRKL